MTDLAQQLRDAYDRNQSRDRAAATGSLLAAEEQDPDTIAAGRQAGQLLQLPAAAADLDPEETQKQAKAKQYRQALDASPKLQEWVRQPGNALVAHDDTERLSWWESATGFAQSFAAAIPETVGIGLQGLSRENDRQGLFQPSGSPALDREFQRLQQAQDQFADAVLKPVGEELEDLGESIDVAPADRTLGNDIAAAFGQLAGQVGLFFLGRGGNAANLTLFYGQGVEQQRRMQEEQGVDPDSQEARQAQALGGLVTLATERLGLEALMARIPTLKNRALRYLAGTAKGATVEGVQEVTEEVVQQVITNAIAENDRSLFDDIERAFAVGGAAGGLVGFLREALTPGRRRGSSPSPGTDDANASPDSKATDHDAIAAINDNARESKLAQRSPDDYQVFVEEVTSGSERDTLYAPAEEMATYLQSKGEDPAAIAASLGLDYSEVVTAAEAGTRIAIPTSAYAARIAAGEHGEWFANNASFTPTGQTLADQANEELATGLRQQAEELQQQIDQELELQAADQQVADAMVSEFTAAGVAPGVARQLGEAVSAFFRTLGQRTGTDALEAFRAVGGIRVRGEVVERLGNLSRDELDKLIDLARTGRTKSSAKREETLIPFLRKQGLVEDRGELKAIGAEKLVKPGGRTLDDAAVAAAEAGYLPELRAELEGDRLATLNPRAVLLDALDRELRGAPVRVPDDAADRADAQAAAVEDLIQTAAQLDVDLSQDNETIKAQINEGLTAGYNRLEERTKGILRGFTSVPVTGIRPDAPATIFLTKDYDLSTALHELGHAFLEVQLATLRENPDAVGLRDDVTALKAWWGRNAEAVAREATAYLDGRGTVTADEVQAFLETDLAATDERTTAIHTGLHEQFARGFEAYLFEGKAPSAGLQEVFRRFKSWMLLIYRQVRRLGVRLDDQARDTFDRMLATEEEIADAREMAGKITPIEAPELQYMTEKQKAAYRKESQEALESSREAVLADLMGELQQTQSKAYERIRAETKATATQIVNARPVYRAREWLANGRWLGDGQPQGLPETKLNKQDLIDLGYEGNLRNPTNRAAGNVILPLIYSAKGGVHPDVLAGLFGFRTGDGMVRAILSSPDRQTAIDEETDSMMRERVGDMLRDGRLEEQALAAVHGESFASVIEAEVRALSSDRPEFQAALSKQARAQAAAMAAGWTPRQAKPELYLRAERGAADASRRALQRGDRQEALKHKQRQLLNHHLWREAKRANEKVEKLLALVSRYRRKATRQNIGPDYIAQIDSLLQRYDFVKRTARELRRDESLVEFIQRMELQGRAVEVDIDPQVVARVNRTNYTKVPIPELEGLLDALKNLEHLGRLKTQLLLENERRELELVVDAVETSIRDSGTFTPQRVGQGTPAQRRGDKLEQYGNLVFTPDTILKGLDGGRDLGPAMEHLKRPIDRAISDRYIPMKEKADNDLAAIFNRYSKREQRAMKTRRELPGIEQPMTKWQMISVALNWGNQGSREALLDGNFHESQVDLILDQLTNQDWQFVQAVWDYLETYWPQIAELQLKRTGVAPEKVPALSVATKHGTFAGGYYPLRYDGGNSTKVGDEDVQNLSREMMAGRFSKAQTRRGHTIERVGSGGRPVLLEIAVLPQHLQRVTYDLSVGEAVHYANRVLGHPRTRKAFEETGRQQTWRTMDLWVKDVAAGETPAGDIEEVVARRIRTGFSVSVMGFNLGTALLQPLGILQTSVQLGKRHTVKGVMKVATSPWSGPRSIFKDIYEMSPVMRNRTEGFNKDVANATADLKAVMPDWLVEAAFYMISRTQQVVDAATWIGAYSKGQETFGGNLEKARDFADGVVKTAQASPLLTDRSALERGTTSERKRQSEMVRMLWTTMASYMYAKANVATQRTRDTSFRDPKQVAAWAGDMALLFVIETLLVAGMRGTFPDDEEDIPGFVMGETLATVLAGLPGIREVTTEVQGFRGGGSLAAFIQAAGRLVTETADDDAGLQDFKAINNVGGIVFRYPSKQINRTVEALIRDLEGEDVAPIDYLMWRQK
ncbi:MAG: hypothetical protein RIC87_15515 [Kiloniellales bacterium]